MPQMSQVLRERAIGMLTAGMSTRAVAREFNVHFSTISFLQCHYREFGSTSNRPHNRRPRVWSQVGERFADVNVVNSVTSWWWGYGMGRYKLWTKNIIAFCQCQLLNAQGYRDEILRPIVMPFIHCHQPMFQHDNAWPHVSRICTQISQFFHCLHTHQTCHLLSMFWMIWIDVYDRVFQFSLISSYFAQPLMKSGTTFHRTQSTA